MRRYRDRLRKKKAQKYHCEKTPNIVVTISKGIDIGCTICIYTGNVGIVSTL